MSKNTTKTRARISKHSNINLANKVEISNSVSSLPGIPIPDTRSELLQQKRRGRPKKHTTKNVNLPNTPDNTPKNTPENDPVNVPVNDGPEADLEVDKDPAAEAPADVSAAATSA